MNPEKTHTAAPVSPRPDLFQTASLNESAVPDVVDGLLRLARERRASDTHISPTKDEVELRWRIDGVLQPLGRMPKAFGPNVVGRLKVLAGLLTYETCRPQEGRIRDPAGDVEFRISTFPTLFGEKVVIRLLGVGSGNLDRVEQLGLPEDANQRLQRFLRATSGAIVICGPAGSGKTTTAYAALREIVAASAAGRSIATLEDPIEVVVHGTVQSQVNDAVGFDMATGLRSLLRQDPEVILIGEIRDRPTAEIALQAALTGQLLVTTFHAGSCAEAILRLTDMGLPGYAIRHALRLIMAQRLVRRLCHCAETGDPRVDAHPLGFQVRACRRPAGCDHCQHTGYCGRVVVAESLTMDVMEVLQTPSTTASDPPIDSLVMDEGVDLWSAAQSLIDQGVTSPAEAIRVLGWRPTSA